MTTRLNDVSDIQYFETRHPQCCFFSASYLHLTVPVRPAAVIPHLRTLLQWYSAHNPRRKTSGGVRRSEEERSEGGGSASWIDRGRSVGPAAFGLGPEAQTAFPERSKSYFMG
jgi:hypothetical protein